MNKALSEREGMKVILKDGKVIKCANAEERRDYTRLVVYQYRFSSSRR